MQTTNLDLYNKNHKRWLICAISCLLSITTGCQYHATVFISAADKTTKAPVTGSRVRDARTNQYLMLAPGEWSLAQYGAKELTIPIILETYCGNLYYQLVVIDKWEKSSTDKIQAWNPVLFEIDGTKENCRIHK